MKIKHLLYCTLFVILMIIVYNLYINNNENINTENFESVLKGLNNKKNSKNNNSSDSKKDNNDDFEKIKKLKIKKKLSSLKSKTTGTSFDDVFKATENMDPDRLSLLSINADLSKYYNSFKKEKFKNNSKNTAESFEKFGLYKEKFFEIFK